MSEDMKDKLRYVCKGAFFACTGLAITAAWANLPWTSGMMSAVAVVAFIVDVVLE